MVKVGTQWCGPCKIAEKTLRTLADNPEFKNIILATIDSDKHDELISEHNIRSIPTILYYKNGKLVDRTGGDNLKQTILSINKNYDQKKTLVPEVAETPAQEKVMPAQEQPKEAPSIAEPQKVEEVPAPACEVQTESFFSRAYNATKDFFANLGETIKSWFK